MSDDCPTRDLRSMAETHDQAIVLDILRRETPTSTRRIIQVACPPEFQKMCHDCGVEIYGTLIKLHRAGLIARMPGESGFVWALVEKDQL